jgi:hypothetical protein
MSNFVFENIAAFKISGVKKLVEAMEKHQTEDGIFSATIDMLFDGGNYPGGEPLDSEGKPEYDSKMRFFWPSADHILAENLVPKLQIVGDRGVYLLTNIKQEESPLKSGLICYAEGCDPERDGDYYDNKVILFGGDDGSIEVPLEWAKWAIKSNKKHLKIKITESSIELIKT